MIDKQKLYVKIKGIKNSFQIFAIEYLHVDTKFYKFWKLFANRIDKIKMFL